MADPYARQIGEVEGYDGERLVVGVDHDAVAIYYGCWVSADGIRLGPVQLEELAQLIVAASWAAGLNKGQMDAETAGERLDGDAIVEAVAVDYARHLEAELLNGKVPDA